MSSALATVAETAPPKGEVVVLKPEQIVDAPTQEEVAAEAKLGIERLRVMSHDELRNVITERVQLLDNVLKERQERAAAIEEAQLAERVLAVRRDRARNIRRKVNIGSSLVAAMFTGIVVARMF
jgi:hypothetical protein